MSEITTERKNEPRVSHILHYYLGKVTLILLKYGFLQVDHSKFGISREVNQDKSEEGTIITEVKRKKR